jgi:hypothetical protein
MANNVIKVLEPPKIPTIKAGFNRPSMFGSNRGFGPKVVPQGKFNQSTFHTQHKGGTSGGK